MPLDLSDYSYTELLILLEPFTNKDLSELPLSERCIFTSIQEKEQALPKTKNFIIFSLEHNTKGVYLLNYAKYGDKTLLTADNCTENFKKILAPDAYLELRKRQDSPLRYLSALPIFEQALAFLSAQIHTSGQILVRDITKIIAEYLLEKQHFSEYIKNCSFFKVDFKQTPEKKSEKPALVHKPGLSECY